jgi:hypothetical protein
LFLFGAIGFWLIFAVRDSLLSAAMMLQVNVWVLRAIDRWAVFLLGLCWLASFILVESYFRHAISRGTMWQRIGRVFLMAGGIALVSWILNWLL